MMRLMKIITLIYFNAGGGHRAAALALEDVMRQQERPWKVRLVNLTEVLDPKDAFRKLTGFAPEDLYNKRLARGWTLGLAQELKLLQAMIRLSHATLVRKLQQHWLQTEPDLVVSLIPNFNRALYESVTTTLPGVPFVTVLTDMADHPPHFWIEPGQRQHLVCGTPPGADSSAPAVGLVISPTSTRLFDDVVHAAYANRIQLWSDGFYRTPKIHYDKTTLTGRPFYYFAYGAACTEVAIDTLTGESRVLAVDILHDVGRSINPALDIGQIEGAFVQGMGWLTTEELVWAAPDAERNAGALLTRAPSTYKIPTTGDIPAHFRIDLWPEPNPEDNVFGSKAVGEPPFMLAISVFEALRDAVASARQPRHGPGLKQAPKAVAGGAAPGRMQLDAPATAERVLGALADQSLR